MYAAFLNPAGRIAFDALIHQLPGPGAPALLLDVEAASAPALAAHLRRYKLRARVDVADASSEWASWGTLGDAPPAAEPLPWRPDPRLRDLGLRAVAPRGSALPLPAAAEPASALAQHRRARLLLGVADGASEMGGELPLECNLEGLSGVSFSKGCYIGQELTARTHYRGVIRKRLLPVAFAAAAAPAPGAEVFSPSGAPAGRVVAVDTDCGIALLRTAAALETDIGAAPTLRLASGSVVAASAPAWWPPAWRSSAGEPGL